MEKAKICIVTTRNIFDAPCLAKYEDVLGEPFDIAYWDRCGIEEKCKAVRQFRYEGILTADASVTDKVKKYIGYIKFIKKILKENKYEKLIVFPTQAAWLILPQLKGEYRGRYIFDIRDYAGENNIILSRLTSKAVECAGLTTVTSPAYSAFLPEKDYLVSHNTQEISDDLVSRYRSRVRGENEKIVLSFIGSVRFIDKQKELINAFKNDERFVLKFIGRGSEQLEDFCKENGVNNVELVGRFERSELSLFYMETDMAINVYGNKNPYLDYALSNKLYSAAIMGMPILVSPNTYMAEITEKYGFGLAVEPSECGLADKVYNYYNSINKKEFFDGCDRFMATVRHEEEIYKETVKAFIG